MPKIIADLENTIIEEAKKQLFEKGYTHMTMRSVSEACGIAVGTVYNYYKSKDMLVADIMLVDWIEIISEVKKSCLKAADIHEAFKYLYDGVVKFSDKYSSVWEQYGKNISVRQNMPDRFEVLIKQLSEILGEVLVRCHDEKDDYMSIFLAEVIINAATNRELDYSNISRILHRIY
ncbi:MAG: TetR/AcrR family transcriptional regulator [Clostridia bacterium]|nr:TetR/AcrR family transcriptional regulator [Clostridia bacterium]